MKNPFLKLSVKAQNTFNKQLDKILTPVVDSLLKASFEVYQESNNNTLTFDEFSILVKERVRSNVKGSE